MAVFTFLPVKVVVIIVIILLIQDLHFDFSDYGFQKKVFDEECTPIRQGIDLDNQIIPDSCPEGTNYSRTQG